MMPLTQAMFLLSETRDQPMHVGSLQLFRPPEGAGPEFLRELYEELLAKNEMSSLFRRRPYRSATTFGQWGWKDDEQIDLEHHVRHSALPHPGRIRELLALTSRLHASLLDRSRPLWEAHLIEGLNDGRYAVYTKMHHALMDGVSAAKLMQRSLSADPDERDMPPPWAPRQRPKRNKDGGGLLAIPKTALEMTSDFVGLGPAVLKRAADQALKQQMQVLPFAAPRSMFNVSITGSRRFAAQSWPIESFKAVAKASDSTLNDVLLAVCSGALRRYLIERDALPGAPLVAMTPVSLRTEEDDDDPDEGGVNVGTILCNLGTDIEDPADRLTTVRESMNAGKEGFKGLSQLQVTALSAGIMLPLFTQMFVDPGYTRPPYNLVISNVPGPTKPLYFNGAQLQGSYPLSIPHHGQAMNITVTSYNGCLEFGIVGCRRTVPHLQRLLTYLDDSLQELTEAVGA
jgi:WS/DGAT/MGAT family acyltransferase